MMLIRIQLVAPTLAFFIAQSFVTDCAGSEGHLLLRGLASTDESSQVFDEVDTGDMSVLYLPKAECSAHPDCASTGLSGVCCPRENGFFMSCCSNVIQVPTPSDGEGDDGYDDEYWEEGALATIRPLTPSPTPEQTDPSVETTSPPVEAPPTNFDSSCAAHPRCARLGLEGTCCPTNTTADMFCCGTNVRPRQCEANAFCKSLDLGLPECCPNKYGLFWACCYKNIEVTESASCSAHPKCASIGVTGQCCPTTNSVFLGCCS